ncbi:SMU1112c/YaeR family gloxylase I-like metalloprotein [Aliagarivorans taiwanensis]|uniref:SMU1112c/YaeR family gloxylase I-like metalloprotein n=1 Tax=Aliagarivorans taiwanensis TaxID=561966 RepID=UPI00040E377F|nr:VOC family protein [Aliagarivorans taiwanensis]
MLNAIHHTALICSDYQRSKHFYSEVLGLTIVSEYYREHRDSYKLDLALPDGSRVELFSFANPPARLSHPEASGLRHLAFSVTNLDDVVSKLTAQGIEVEPIRVDELTDKRFTFFADPDGLPLELYEE